MEVITIKNAVPIEAAFKAWSMLNDKTIEIIHLVLSKGEVIENHVNPVDVVFYVLNGTGRLTVEGQQESLLSHALIKVEAGKQRKWENNGFTELRMLVIKELKKN